MFKSIKNNYHKSLGAVVAQNLLEMHARHSFLDIDPHMTANRMVEAVWTENPHLFDGRFGQRPHKISLAAAAFAKVIQDRSHGQHETNIYGLCLGTILSELATNGNRYPLNGIDVEILQSCEATMMSLMAEVEDSPLHQEVSELLAKAKEEPKA